MFLAAVLQEAAAADVEPLLRGPRKRRVFSAGVSVDEQVREEPPRSRVARAADDRRRRRVVR